MPRLEEMACHECAAGTEPLRGEHLAGLFEQLGEGWQVVREHHLCKIYKFPDFSSALAFVNRVGELAEQQEHHPEIYLGWGKVRVELWTHKIDGLSESDFVMAARIDQLPRQ